MSAKAPSREAILERLRTDFIWWAENCATIVNSDGEQIPFRLKPAQLRIWEAIKAQQDADRPVRIIVPKARKEGVSTMAVGMMVHRTTLRAHHNAISVAQDRETAGELLNLASVIHSLLPDTEEWPIKPPIANRQRRQELVFGNPSRVSQVTGDMGLNSRLVADTAQEFDAGRGFTYHYVHCSEVAFWTDAKRKLTSLLNAVPDRAGTMVILESTSNGHNHWRQLCMDALDGLNDFTIVFLPWFEEPDYARVFVGEQEREEFIESIGTGPYGDEEPTLVEDHGCSPEQLHWRRWAIANRCQGDLRVFHQEYPATLEQSFLATGSHVFNQELVAKARTEAERSPEPVVGGFSASQWRTSRRRFGTVEVPVGPKWTPDRRGDWEVWQEPETDAQYVLAVDPAGDEVMDANERAMHAICVIDHRTRRQVAQLEAQGDADLIAVQIYLAALYYNRAWVGIETTGGWGLSMARRIFKDYGYPFVYRRKRLEAGKESQDDRLGFDTNRVSKVILEDGAREVLREGTHGIRSTKLARQFTTYVKDVKGKSGPAPGERSDLLMAWMIAHQIAQELSIRRFNGEGSGVISTTGHAVRSTVTGY